MKLENQIKLDGIEKKIISEVIEQKLWFKIDQKVFSIDLVELNQSSFSKNKTKQKSTDQILAPMPGKVTKIFVSQGQAVKKGDALLVMEAMKMEYTLKSDIDSKVESVFVNVNDQVVLGYLLIQLKAHNP